MTHSISTLFFRYKNFKNVKEKFHRIISPHLKAFSKKEKKEGQPIYIQVDLYLNFVNYQSCLKVNKILNLLFQHSFMPVVTRPSRISKNNAALIDNMNINSFSDWNTAT